MLNCTMRRDSAYPVQSKQRLLIEQTKQSKVCVMSKRSHRCVGIPWTYLVIERPSVTFVVLKC
jgi:hypothetical protein